MAPVPSPSPGPPSFSSQMRDIISPVTFSTGLVALVCAIATLATLLGLTSPQAFCLVSMDFFSAPVTQLFHSLTSPYFHFGLLHLTFNLMALFPLGIHFERSIGSLRFLYLICLIFPLAAGLIHGLISNLLALLPHSLVGNLHSCSAGISGIIFALIVIDIYTSASSSAALETQSRRIFCLPVPALVYPWVLLAFIQILVPQSSFLGHFSGLVVGYLYCWGCFHRILLPPSLLQKCEGLPTVPKLHGFVFVPSHAPLLPLASAPQIPSPSSITGKLSAAVSHLQNSWRYPTSSSAMTTSPTTPSSLSSAPSTTSMAKGYSQNSQPAQTAKFPGQGHVLGNA